MYERKSCDISLKIDSTTKLIHRYLFDSTSLFFIYEQDEEHKKKVLPAVYLIDFERVSITAGEHPDVPVVTSVRHVVNEMRRTWNSTTDDDEKKDDHMTVYLVSEEDTTAEDDDLQSR